MVVRTPDSSMVRPKVCWLAILAFDGVLGAVDVRVEG